MEVAIMIEGQMGLTWDRWQRLAKAVEDLGFVGLYRSDHYTNPKPPDRASLELWISLAWLASHTKKIDFGPLVTPLSFRDPTMTARMASAGAAPTRRLNRCSLAPRTLRLPSPNGSWNS